MNPDAISRRARANADRGMVTSPHRAASEDGAAVLAAGGSAVDAAIAASATLAVVYPHMTSIGGDAFWLVWDAAAGTARFVNGGGRAARAATIGWFRDRGHAEIPLRGAAAGTMTTPGSVASWCAAHAAYGRAPLARCLAPAIAHARDGFPATPKVAHWTAQTAPVLAQSPEAAGIFLPGGRPPGDGERVVNPDLARTLERVAASGHAGFYAGETARELARFAADQGGLFTEDDLAAQDAPWGAPISTVYRGVTVYETPPPTQGVAVLQMLNLLEPVGLGAMPYLGPDHVHTLVQAKQIAFHDRDRVVADPAFVDVPVERLLSRAHADDRRQLMDPKRALPWDRVPSWGSLAGDTVWVGAVDRWGNAASLVQSLYSNYGSGVVAGRTGVVLQNRGAYFSLDAAHPNRLEPGKRPLHTLIASLAVRDGRLWQVLGCMGADGQPQIHAQCYTAVIDFGLDVAGAVEAPRWLAGRFGLGEPRDLLNLEARFPAGTIDELERRGHVVNRWGDWNERAGHAHGITIEPGTRARLGAADPRSDGAAVAEPA